MVESGNMILNRWKEIVLYHDDIEYEPQMLHFLWNIEAWDTNVVSYRGCNWYMLLHLISMSVWFAWEFRSAFGLAHSLNHSLCKSHVHIPGHDSYLPRAWFLNIICHAAKLLGSKLQERTVCNAFHIHIHICHIHYLIRKTDSACEPNYELHRSIC